MIVIGDAYYSNNGDSNNNNNNDNDNNVDGRCSSIWDLFWE